MEETDSPLTITADNACFNVAYKEEIDDLNYKNDEEGIENDQEYIIVTLDENQSVESLLSNLDQHPQLQQQLQQQLNQQLQQQQLLEQQTRERISHDFVVVTSAEEATEPDSLDVDEKKPLELQLEQQLQHQSLQEPVPRDILVVTSGEETIEHDSLDEKIPFQVHSDIPSMPDLVWTGNGDIELQKVFKDEGVENEVPRDQIIYVNAEDVVASDPAEQYIVIEHG